MEKGFNSDLSISGIAFHVQTEDWGVDCPFFVSQVFQNGAVKKSIKTPYSKVLSSESMGDKQAIRLAMRTQHQSILDLLVSGQL